MAADALESPFFELHALCLDVLAAVLHRHDAIEIDGVADMCAKKLQSTLRHWPPEELPVELCRLHSEMTLVCEEMAKDVPLVHAGALSSADVSDDVGHRLPLAALVPIV